MASFTIADATGVAGSFTVDLVYNRTGQNTWSLNMGYAYDMTLTRGETSGNWTLSYGPSHNNDFTVFGSVPTNSWNCQGVDTSLWNAVTDADPFENVPVGATGGCLSSNPADPVMTWTRAA